MTESLVSVMDDPDGVRTLAMNRPPVNAFDEHLIGALTAALEAVETDPGVRIVVLTGAGKRAFSAGADIAWMQRAGTYTEAENLADAKALAKLLSTLDRLTKPTVARVNGPAIGGAVGLVAACDVAIASERAVFATTEVRLGIVPAVVSPFVVRAVGARWARRLFLTGETLDARRAATLGLVHEVVAEDALDATVEGMVAHLLRGGPLALVRAKQLAAQLATPSADDGQLDLLAHLIAGLRATEEAQEGLRAFLAKRPPVWV